MAFLYAAAGINHFANPTTYLAIMPPWLPAPDLLIFISGLAEILLATLLVIPATQYLGAWGLIFLLVAVFPANLQMMLNYAKAGHPMLWLAVIRLPVQVLLIWWAFQYTKKGETIKVNEVGKNENFKQ